MDEVVGFTPEKGREKRRIDVSRRMEAELAASLAAGPTGDLAYPRT